MDLPVTSLSPQPPPTPLSGERYHLSQLLPSQELENLNFFGSKTVPEVWCPLPNPWNKSWRGLGLNCTLANPRTSVSSFLSSPRLSTSSSLLSLSLLFCPSFSEGILLSKVEIPVDKSRLGWIQATKCITHYDTPPFWHTLLYPSWWAAACTANAPTLGHSSFLLLNLHATVCKTLTVFSFLLLQIPFKVEHV